MNISELVMLLYTARERYTKIRVAWQYSYDVDAMNLLVARWTQQQPTGSVMTLQSSSPSAATAERYTLQRRVWWQKPDCWRDENGGLIIILCNGRAAYFDINAEPDDPLTQQIQAQMNNQPLDIEDRVDDIPLLDPAFLLASHALEPLHETTHAGRKAVVVRATYRKGKSRAYEPMFWTTADSYQLTVDRERGILLRYAAILDDEEFAVASVDAVVFDGPIDASVFALPPTP